ncbi:unnamed protein product [Clonostachys rosea]|uniref:Sulfatase N-terminal domain-containing protein n=1 Tax=Bionectria ochroleuca TaxID=29856 RepID=A0ABY6UDV2_BIOOC|nr:unnamed protein product [Clonostachys rosea]
MFSLSFPLAPLIFTSFCSSLIFTKLITLGTHFHAVPFLAFVFYLPTFFLLDFIAICLLRFLLNPVRGWFSLFGFIVGILISLFTLCGAASQLGFFYKTGGELAWHEATSFATNKDGLKVLLSGSWAVLASAGLLMGVSFLLQTLCYRVVGLFNSALGANIIFPVAQFVLIRCQRAQFLIIRKTQYYLLRGPAHDEESELGSINSDLPSSLDSDSDSHTYLGDDEKDEEGGNRGKLARMIIQMRDWWAIRVAVVLFFLVALLVRPHRPYDHMSVTLPVSMLNIFRPESDYCSEQRRIHVNPFPFPHLLSEKNWEAPNEYFRGWAPGARNEQVLNYRYWNPEWMPEEVHRGFERWDPRRVPEYSPFYNPVDDPLKISNLDNDILKPLKGALSDGSVKIKHVVYILMESLREELFPLQQDSFIHKNILNANEEEERDEMNRRLADVTPHIEMITGVPGNFRAANGSSYERSKLKWQDSSKEGFGGINIVGGTTGSTMSTKSFGTNFCGTWGMPVEKFEEYATDSYQPCLPQIMGLMNEFKSDDKKSDDYREWKWHPKFFMSVTEGYDHMDKFDRKIGLEDRVCEAELKDDIERNVTSGEGQKIGYFGFAEPILKPYITEYLTNATKNNERIMMAHFTSTTHHPWELPSYFNMTDYMPSSGLHNWHKDFNKYINTIRFHDLWMAELMSLFDELGIADETLIVFAGDHGQAFKEDARKTGTYENGHISNYRVPITFRHPHLPRYQYNVNATTVSTLPTILDLLINSGSLNEKDRAVASDLIQDYEGQSLIRPYKTSHNGRRAWNFGITNSGAGMLAVTSADSPWRLVMPLDKTFEYSLSNLEEDQQEEHALTAWTFKDLLKSAKKEMGEGAVEWAKEAEAIGKWWRKDRQRLWRYHEIEET